MKRYFKALGYLLSVHVLALLVMTLFRLVEFIALHGMIVDAGASRVMAFVKGVWFDNVIACYISVLPVAVLLVAASLGWCHRRLLRGINIWYAAWFAIAFMPSAANTPYFQYFFKNINSSIFGWFGYVATTSGMLLQESSYWLYIALYFVFTGAFIYALVRLRRYFEGLFLLPKDNMHLVQVVSRFLISAVMIGACLFGIRGRMGYNPIKVSQAYYCEDSFLNQLGINPAFNLLTSALDDMRKENKELHLMPYAEAITNTRQWLGIMGKVDSTNILKREVVNDSLMMKMGQSPAKKNHPNVVVILMESMSANLLGTFGNQQPLTPTLDSLYHHSLAMKKRFDVNQVFLTTSCTHALEMAAFLCDIQPGDEVIMPSYTFVSTADAFVLRGAKIVFVDIRPDTMNIDENLIEQAITDKTRAIVPVHYAGVGCEMNKIMELAKKYNLKVVEDAAQGVEAYYHGKALGTIGDFGCYSFHETKNYTMGEGGALVFQKDEYQEKAEILREKGTDRSKFFRGQVDKYRWIDYGSSYLPSEMNAAYLYAQLEECEKINHKRHEIYDYYHANLKNLEDEGKIQRPFVPEGCVHNAHMYYIKTRDLSVRSRLIAYLKENGICTAFHYVPLHSSPAGEKFGRFSGDDVYTT